LNELNSSNEDEHERRRKILNNYIKTELKLRAKEEIYDLSIFKDSALNEEIA